MFKQNNVTLTSTEARDIIAGLNSVLAEAERNLRLAFLPDITERQNRVDCLHDLIEKIRAVANSK